MLEVKMIKEIVKDIDFLQQKSTKFEFDDDNLIQDLLDTAEHYRYICLGLAAIQIGVPKRVIVVKIKDKFVPFINPTILQRSHATYVAQEGCMSLEGKREARRHFHIKVGYTTKEGKVEAKTFDGITSQIIQHEINHLNGVLI